MTLSRLVNKLLKYSGARLFIDMKRDNYCVIFMLNVKHLPVKSLDQIISISVIA